MYFEADLISRTPEWLTGTAREKFIITAETVEKRHELLEEALEMSGMQPDTFAASAKFVFDAMEKANPGSFDFLSPIDIAQTAYMYWDKKTEAEKRLEWNNADILFDTAFVSTRDWEELRHVGIGGSDASVVLGMSHYRTQRELYYDKLDKRDPAKEMSNPVFDRGHYIEPVVIQTFCDITGAHVIPETRMFASKTHPYSTANIDAIVGFDDGKVYIFEAKTTVAGNYKSWANGKIPPEYVPQMRQYAAVLDDEKIQGVYIGCMFVQDMVLHGRYGGSSYDSDDFKIRYIERSADIEKDILRKEERWVKNHLIEDAIPDISFFPESLKEREIEFCRDKTRSADKAHRIYIPEADKLMEDIEKYEGEKDAARKEKAVFEKKIKESEEKIAICKEKIQEAVGLTNKCFCELKDDKETYMEITNSVSSRKSVLKDERKRLEELIDVCAHYLPENLTESLKSCITQTEVVKTTIKRKKKDEKYRKLVEEAKA